MFRVLKEFVRHKCSAHKCSAHKHVCGRLISVPWIIYLINQKLRRPPDVVREREGFDSGYEEQTSVLVP
jgi:hypothetical protein